MLVEIGVRVLPLVQEENGMALQQRVSGDVCCTIEVLAER